MTEDHCGVCRFWMFDINKGAGDGACRRYPPLIVTVPDRQHKGNVGVASFFPSMQPSGWCGEFKPKVLS